MTSQEGSRYAKTHAVKAWRVPSLDVESSWRCGNPDCNKGFRSEGGLEWHLAHAPACARAYARGQGDPVGEQGDECVGESAGPFAHDGLVAQMEQERARRIAAEAKVARWVAWNKDRKKRARARRQERQPGPGGPPFFACPVRQEECDGPVAEATPGACPTCGVRKVELSGTRTMHEAIEMAGEIHTWLENVLGGCRAADTPFRKGDLHAIYKAMAVLQQRGLENGRPIWATLVELDAIAYDHEGEQFPVRTSMLVRKMAEEMFEEAARLTFAEPLK